MKDGRVSFVRCNFTDNVAASGEERRRQRSTGDGWTGGAVYSRGGEAHFDNCRFEGNAAQAIPPVSSSSSRDFDRRAAAERGRGDAERG
eukprot:753796-Hanusia_phi.AAC.1